MRERLAEASVNAQIGAVLVDEEYLSENSVATLNVDGPQLIIPVSSKLKDSRFTPARLLAE